MKKIVYISFFIVLLLVQSCVDIGDDDFIEKDMVWIEANIFFDDGKVEQAWELYKSIENKYKNSYKLNYKLGLISSRSGWSELALKYLKRVLEIKSSFWLAQKEIAIMYKSKYEYQSSLEEINKILNNPDLDAESYFLVAFLNIKNKTTTNPESFFQKSLELDPSFVMSSLHYGSYLIGKKDFDKSDKIIKNGLKYNPTNSSLIELYCSIKMLEKKYSEAIERYKTYTEKNPKWGYGFLQIGTAYEKLGNYRLAEEYYNKSVQIDRNLRFGWQSLATVKERFGKIDEALEIWESLAISYDEPYYDFKAADLLKHNLEKSEVFIKKLKNSTNSRAKEYLKILKIQ